jgi:hypothetical protein
MHFYWEKKTFYALSLVLDKEKRAIQPKMGLRRRSHEAIFFNSIPE